MQSQNPSRSAVGFLEATRAAFDFLRRFDFREVGAEETIVRYASGNVFLNVYHGRSSYELGIELGLLGAEAPGHSMSALIRLSDAEEAASFRNTVAVTREEVRRGVQELAEQLKKYGEPGLKGDTTFFAGLDRARREWAEDYAAEVAYRQVLPQADEAFRRHEYGKATELYESIRGKLTPAELKKLEYARKHA